jgi:hypothetical protein
MDSISSSRRGPPPIGSVRWDSVLGMRPSLRWIVTFAVVASMAAFGWFWGLRATDRPALELGYLPRDSVQVWTTDPGGNVRLWWTMSSAGRVEIDVWLDRSSDTPAIVTMVLECDARLQNRQFDTYLASVTLVTQGDDARACTTHRFSDRDEAQRAGNSTPVQIFELRFSAAGGLGRAQVWGDPVEAWSDAAAGERASEAPFIYVGAPETRYAGSLNHPLLAPARIDILTKLLSTESETLDSFFPNELDSPGAGATGEVRATMSQNSLETRGPEVSWSTSWSRDGEVAATGARIPIHIHTAARATWSDAGGKARAQLQLLLSGLLLGVVGAVAVETVLAWARGRARAEAPPGLVPRAVRRSHVIRPGRTRRRVISARLRAKSRSGKNARPLKGP